VAAAVFAGVLDRAEVGDIPEAARAAAGIRQAVKRSKVAAARPVSADLAPAAQELAAAARRITPPNLAPTLA
jgi:hypothetical protein